MRLDQASVLNLQGVRGFFFIFSKVVMLELIL